MKKFMFDDRFGLTDAVINGEKTMTRRMIPASVVSLALKNAAESYVKRGCHIEDLEFLIRDEIVNSCGTRVGEVVAVAQRYEQFMRYPFEYRAMPGWNNKMFVKAELMPHQIEITYIHVEHIQAIFDDECMKEGVKLGCNGSFYIEGIDRTFDSPRRAFKALFNKIAGAYAWDHNPLVLVYNFKLIS